MDVGLGHVDVTVGLHAGEPVADLGLGRGQRADGGGAAAHATSVHLDNTLEDYRREIQRRVFG